MPRPQADVKPTMSSQQQQFVFVDGTPKHTASLSMNTAAQKKSIRAQAAKASSDARLDTLRRRAATRTAPPGQRVFSVIMPVKPLACIVHEKHKALVREHQVRETSIATQAHKILGGSIPVAQADTAILAQFLGRFRTEAPTERPWVTLVMTSAGTSGTYTSSSILVTALQANANALFANDLRLPELFRHATKQHLWVITKLQSELRSSRWLDPTILYTCMVLTLYEVCAIRPQPTMFYPDRLFLVHCPPRRPPFSSGSREGRGPTISTKSCPEVHPGP
nr:hypothetical protein CFP56_21370 [Quercus suber]